MSFLSTTRSVALGAIFLLSACGGQPAFAETDPLVTTDPACYPNSFKVISKLSAAGYRVEHTFEHKSSSTILATRADGRYVVLSVMGDSICIMMEGTLVHVDR